MRITKFKNSKGFTLIELLVVIAIIGILATIILSSLGDSRTKAFDAQVKEQLSRFRASAEVYFSNQSPVGYTPAVNDCDSAMFADVTTINGSPGLYLLTGNLPVGIARVCQSNQYAYAVKVELPSGGYFCVDSKGAARVYAGVIGAPGTVCPP